MSLLLTETGLERLLIVGGRIDQAHRSDIVKCLNERHEGEGEEFIRATQQTRHLIRKTSTYFAKGLEGLTRLEGNREFIHYNAKLTPQETSEQIDRWRHRHADAVGLIDSLSSARKRMARRSVKGVEDYLRSCFITELLELRTDSLGIDVPLQASETTMSGPFLQFLELALRITEPDLKESEIKGTLKRALAISVKGFAFRRANLDYCWQWEELFPQTAHVLLDNAFP